MEGVGGAGRGRGRGKRPPEPERRPSPPPVVVGQQEEVQVQSEDSPSSAEETFQAMYGTSATAGVGDSDRGRTRGRGIGRSRAPEPAVTPRRELEGEQYQRRQELEARFADVELDPESPKELEVPPPDGGSPPVPAFDEGVAMPGGLDGDQLETISSAAGASSRKRDFEVEEDICIRAGTKGDPVPLMTNYLRLKLLDNHPGVVEYHVSIQPHLDQVRGRRKLLSTAECKKIIGEVKSFDGMTLFLPQILSNDITVIETSFEDDPATKYRVQITFEKVKLMKDAVMFFNILLHRIMRELQFKELRREYYDLDMIVALNQHKLEIWPGVSLSSENQEDGLMICVDTCSRVLRQDTVYDHLKALKGDPQMKTKFEQFMINKIVMTKYNNKCYRIDEVRWDLQPSSTFAYRDKEVSFVEYLKLKYPTAGEIIDASIQPMLMSKLKPRKNEKFTEEEGRVAALVPQMCYITGLTEDQKNNFKVMTDLAEATRLVPTQRIVNLQNFIERLLGSEIVKKILRDWGLCIEKEIIEVRGRRVEGPNLEFNQRMQVQKAPPDFSREAGKAVYEPITVRNYVVLCTARDADKARRFMDTYKEVAGPLGIRMLQGGTIQHVRGMRPADFSDALMTHCKEGSGVHFVVIIMPMQRDDVYAAIKRYCVNNSPIPSQCILSKTLGNEKRLRSIVLKIVLQINCKLGGSLWALKMPLKEEIMFIGIDSAHDPLKKDASVICLVASLNNECTKYFSKSSTSKTHMELGESLGPMTIEALKEYRNLKGKFPNRIVIFRDGGSVGALDTIGTTEMTAMKKAIDRLCGDEVQNFTFALVTKRISQRFFAKVGRTDRVENPPPGTIVDGVVTRRHLYDFYVVSQQVRQGTVNPTHFIIVDKEDPIRPDLIHKLAYVTCFMYYNWSGTVRVPAMVQYAHKLAALLSRHVKSTPHRDIATTLYYL